MLSALDLKDSSVLWARNPAEELIDRKPYPITDLEWLQLAARNLGLPEHRPTEQEKPR